MTRRLARRPTLAAALVSLALAAVMVGPGLLPGRALSSSDMWWFSTPWTAERPADLTHSANADLEDAAQQFQPLREEVKRQLPDVPLWNPWIAGGRPLLADAQSAVFSPFTLPAYVMPLQKSLAWTALLTLWTAIFGMFLLGRALGMRFAGALMAGLVYGLNLWLVSHLSYPHSGVWALLPWMLLATERLVRRPGATSVALLAVPVGLQYLAGHPETSFQVLLATLAFFTLRVVQARERGVRAPLIAMAAALVAGTGLAAVMLAPFGELLFHSADLAERSGTGIGKHVDPTYLLGFFMYDYWGRATDTPLLLLLFSRSWYIGALPLMLVAAALILRPRAERLWIAGAAAVLLAVIFGVPPFVQIGTRLPLLSLGHNDRLILIVLACASLLAGWGLDDLRAPELPARKRRAVADRRGRDPAGAAADGGRAQRHRPAAPQDGAEGGLPDRHAAPGRRPQRRRRRPAGRGRCCGCARPVRRWSCSSCACGGCPSAPSPGWRSPSWRSISSGPGWATTRRSRPTAPSSR